MPDLQRAWRELIALQKTFTAFLAARESTLDCLAAERALRQLLAS